MNMTTLPSFCFNRKIMSHPMLHALCCITLRLEKKGSHGYNCRGIDNKRYFIKLQPRKMSKYKRTSAKDKCVFVVRNGIEKRIVLSYKRTMLFFFSCVAEHDKGLDFSLIVMT